MNTENIRRQKVWERDNLDLSYDERFAIGEKSDHMCCHCGKKAFPEFGATIDHFIPLSQGGKTIKPNLIMLCKECNEEKGSRIYEPETYLKYLKEEPKKELIEYFNSYIRSFDFFERRNILACDKYTFDFYPPNITFRQKNKKVYPHAVFRTDLIRIDKDDFNEAREYYIKYLKKLSLLDSIEDADKNLSFFTRFGCLYAMKQNNEISVLIAVTLCDHILMAPEEAWGDYSRYSIMLTVMPYYNNDKSYNISSRAIKEIGAHIRKEQGLSYILMDIYTFPGETFLNKFGMVYGFHHPTRNFIFPGDKVIGIRSGESFSEEGKNDLTDFFRMRQKQEPEIEEFFKENPGQTFLRQFIENQMTGKDQKEEEMDMEK